ncbi:MAG: GntR family transcriptional regulator [Tannerellaceae bacterium]|nr:GntR family transcriptional regulator [Tannerellaceae bacterium]
MEFDSNKPIYLQIIDFCFRKIISKEWKEEERILSVRELGVLLEVNPNTIVRSYEHMQASGIIYLKRGMGYYVCQGAEKLIIALQKEEFFNTTLPATFEQMKLLGISIDEIVIKYQAQNK